MSTRTEKTNPHSEEVERFSQKLPLKYKTIHQVLQDLANSYRHRHRHHNPKDSESEPSPVPNVEPTGNRIKIRKFKYFTKLPLEVRLMIWAECAHVSRVIQFDHYDPSVRRPIVPFRFINACPGCIQVFVQAGGKVPTMLQVNQESRREGLRYYEKPFGGFLGRRSPYFNFAVDVLHLWNSIAGEVIFGHGRLPNRDVSYPCHCVTTSSIHQNNLSEKLRHLSITQWDLDWSQGPGNPKFSLGFFPQLQTFTFGTDMFGTIMNMIDLGKFELMEDLLGSDHTISGRLDMKHISRWAMTDFFFSSQFLISRQPRNPRRSRRRNQ
ncbi:hypothetical protein ONS95_008433 [Cadophora gregata]|uniref:uncharacterized protein n=1 Tax=Cadophora gregata TaxID=51156 RepID=UPI0026DB2E8B|nr:uncharacterized protein ONS95_008433 [Cadophora gregata]KAK0100484.1 hypothetical protein ONS96_007760 [Cadophora gregata f. sp. sojae]KAK0126854.1 hypothetical protein ONS95_008433 [Cadophora gregata]